MLKKYRNELLNTITGNGLNVEDFDLTEVVADDGTKRVTIRFRDSMLYFFVFEHESSYHVFKYQYSLFTKNNQLSTSLGEFQDFGNLSQNFHNWINNDVNEFIGEQDKTDKWEKILKKVSLVADISSQDSDYSAFGEEEKKELRSRLTQFQEAVIEKFDPSEEQLREINKNIQYASKALDRLNKIDWRAIVLQTLISLTITLTLSKNDGESLIDLFRSFFSSVLKLIE